MDYLCDHPAGFVVGYLYPDAGKAIKEGLTWNITFPETQFLFVNMLIFYLPMTVLCGVQLRSGIMFQIGCALTAIGFVSNGWRFKMKNDHEAINSNS